MLGHITYSNKALLSLSNPQNKCLLASMIKDIKQFPDTPSPQSTCLQISFLTCLENISIKSPTLMVDELKFLSKIQDGLKASFHISLNFSFLSYETKVWSNHILRPGSSWTNFGLRIRFIGQKVLFLCASVASI